MSIINVFNSENNQNKRIKLDSKSLILNANTTKTYLLTEWDIPSTAIGTNLFIDTLVKDIDTNSVSYNKYINGDGVLTIGYDVSSITIYNESNYNLDIIIRLLYIDI